MSVRTERVAGEIKNAIAHLFQTDFGDFTDGLLTVTNVRMAPDLRSGRVYLSILGGTTKPEEALKKIKAIAPQLRSGVAKQVSLKFAPELFYYLDDTMEEVAKIEEIFKKIRADRPPEPLPPEPPSTSDEVASKE